MSAGSVSRAVCLGCLACGLGLVSQLGCGDDGANPTDAGVASDAATVRDSGPDRIPRRDAQVSSSDLIPPCDRADPAGCGPGRTCDLLIRRAPGETQFIVYTGCVLAGTERALGDPCDSMFDGPVYMEPGLQDEVHTDPCGPGLVCAPDRKVRGATTCQPLCQSPNSGLGSPIACESKTAVCTAASNIVEFCLETEGCDVMHQKGCRSGEACYLRPSDDGKQLLSICRSKPDMPVADGAMCQSYAACAPGSVCMGPARLPITRWTQADLRCRAICDGMSDEDAGVGDADGGVGGACGDGTQCVPYAESGFGLSGIPVPPFGQCE